VWRRYGFNSIAVRVKNLYTRRNFPEGLVSDSEHRLSLSNNNSVQAEAYKLVYWQFAVIVGLALILFLFAGARSGLSVFLGGAAYCLPNYIFVRRVFANPTARAANQFLAAFFLGETAKLFLSAILCVLIVKYLPVTFAYVLGGYCAAIFAFFLGSFFVMSKSGGDAHD
jgi:ATP synthase protein I